MKEPKAVTIYETSDGRNFPTYDQALHHEQILELAVRFTQMAYYEHVSAYEICKWFMEEYDLIPRINVAS